MNDCAIEAGITIRTGRASELDTYAEFWLAMFEEVGLVAESDMLPDWRARFSRYLEGRIAAGEARFFVAVDGDAIVATAGALLSDGYPFVVHGIKRGYIFGVRVDPRYRGRGIASALTESSIDFLRRLGCTKIRLHASRFGRGIYEKLGFTPTNEMELV